MNKICSIALSFFAITAIAAPAKANSLQSECDQLLIAAGGGSHLVSQFYTGAFMNEMPPSTATGLARQMNTVIGRLNRLSLSNPRTRQIRSSYVSDFRRFVQRMNTWASNPPSREQAIESLGKGQPEGTTPFNRYTSVCIYKLD